MVQHAEIKPECFYDQDALRRLLGLSNKAIGNACRSGKLKFSEQAGRRFFRGAWVIAWLEGDSAHSTSGGGLARK
jgi:hypothetical protein